MRIAVAGGTGTVGRHVVAAAEARGHQVEVLSRSNGIDLMTGHRLRAAIADCDAVIDVASTGTLSTRKAVGFFSTVTSNLLTAEKSAGVPHHIALSIIGAAGVEAGHYAGKSVQEQLITDGGRPWTILRATQFHEFAVQMATRPRVLGMVMAPKMRTQPIAAAEVAAALVESAEDAPGGFIAELAGPREENLADMIRRYLKASGQHGRVLEVAMPGAMGKALTGGALLATPGARLGTQTFERWLSSQGARVR
ncbi:MAG TPA: NAD(P)H-binding protein [Gryllotalpicola sp.]